MNYFETYLDLDFPNEDGTTKRQHLLQVLQTAPKDSSFYREAEEILNKNYELPACFEHIWEWFWELSNARSYDGMSGLPNPISFTEIKNWAELKGIVIRDYEVDLIRKLDKIFINFFVKRRLQTKETIGKKNA